jgi:hypothetical protein
MTGNNLIIKRCRRSFKAKFGIEANYVRDGDIIEWHRKHTFDKVLDWMFRQQEAVSYSYLPRERKIACDAAKKKAEDEANAKLKADADALVRAIHKAKYGQ